VWFGLVLVMTLVLTMKRTKKRKFKNGVESQGRLYDLASLPEPRGTASWKCRFRALSTETTSTASSLKSWVGVITGDMARLTALGKNDQHNP
jgi:hypothetical protein